MLIGDRENEAGSWYIQGLERSTSDKEPIIDSSRPRVKLRLLDDQKKACASFVDNEMRAMSVVNLYNTKDMDFAGK